MAGDLMFFFVVSAGGLLSAEDGAAAATAVASVLARLRWLRRLRRLGGASTSAADPLDSISGSTSILGSLDSSWWGSMLDKELDQQPFFEVESARESPVRLVSKTVGSCAETLW